MTTCPYCSHGAAAGSRVCGSCGRALIQRCVACAEDIPVLSHVCPLCRSPQNVPAAKGGSTLPAAPRPASMPAMGPVGEDRNIVLILFLWFITCGFWGLVALYQVGTELKSHRPGSDLSPGTDILLGILTCGIWFIFVLYKYAQVLREITEVEGGPIQDVTMPCLVLQICKYFGCPGIVSVLVLQNELNTHWKRHTHAS